MGPVIDFLSLQVIGIKENLHHEYMQTLHDLILLEICAIAWPCKGN